MGFVCVGLYERRMRKSFVDWREKSAAWADVRKQLKRVVCPIIVCPVSVGVRPFQFEGVPNRRLATFAIRPSRTPERITMDTNGRPPKINADANGRTQTAQRTHTNRHPCRRQGGLRLRTVSCDAVATVTAR